MATMKKPSEPLAVISGGGGNDSLLGGKRTIAGTAAARGLSRVDPRLVQIIDAAAARSPYDVQIFSGIRSGSKGGSRHNTGNALDIALIDPTTGQVIPNYKSSTGFPIYAEFAKIAREEQMQIAPDMANQFRWGGGFSDKDFDLMHFDFKPGGAMAYWTWADGGRLTEAGAKAVPKFGAGWVYANGERRRAPEGQYASLWGRDPLQATPSPQDPQTAIADLIDPGGAVSASPSPIDVAMGFAPPAQEPSPADAVIAGGGGAETLVGGTTPPTPRLRQDAVGNQIDALISGSGPHRGEARTRPDYTPPSPPDPATRDQAVADMLDEALFGSGPHRGDARTRPERGDGIPNPPPRASGIPNPPSNPRRDPSGFPIDVNRPRIDNADGSFSTEQTITFNASEVGLPDEIVTVPTIINGRKVSDQEAMAAFAQGQNEPVQRGFSSFDDADKAAEARTGSIAAARATNGERQFPSIFGEQPQQSDADAVLETLVAGRPDVNIGSLPAASRTGDLSAAMGGAPQEPPDPNEVQSLFTPESRYTAGIDLYRPMTEQGGTSGADEVLRLIQQDQEGRDSRRVSDALREGFADLPPNYQVGNVNYSDQQSAWQPTVAGRPDFIGGNDPVRDFGIADPGQTFTPPESLFDRIIESELGPTASAGEPISADAVLAQQPYTSGALSGQALQDQFDVAFAPSPQTAQSAIDEIISPSASMGALPFASQAQAATPPRVVGGDGDFWQTAPESDFGLGPDITADSVIGEPAAGTQIPGTVWDYEPPEPGDPLYSEPTWDMAPDAVVAQPAEITYASPETADQVVAASAGGAGQGGAPTQQRRGIFGMFGGGDAGGAGGGGGIFGSRSVTQTGGGTTPGGKTYQTGTSNALGGSKTITYKTSDGRTVTTYEQDNNFGQPQTYYTTTSP